MVAGCLEIIQSIDRLNCMAVLGYVSDGECVVGGSDDPVWNN